MNAHLSTDELAAMVDGRLPPTRRVHVKAHLAICRECRSELALVTQIVETAPHRRTVSRRWAASLGLAAAAVLVFVSLPAFRSRSTPAADVRASAPAASSIAVIVPPAGSSQTSGSSRFSWHAVAGVSIYRLFIIDSAGVPVRTLTTNDTTMGPFATWVLGPGRYFWYVDALRVDGSTIASAPAGFSIHPR